MHTQYLVSSAHSAVDIYGPQKNIATDLGDLLSFPLSDLQANIFSQNVYEFMFMLYPENLYPV